MEKYLEYWQNLEWEILLDGKPLIPTGGLEYDIQFPRNGGMWGGKKMTIRTKGHRRSSNPADSTVPTPRPIGP